MIQRQELLVYFNYKASLVQSFIEYGATVEYVNKKAGYAVLYIDKDKANNLTNFLRHAKGIRKYEFSEAKLVELDIN